MSEFRVSLFEEKARRSNADSDKKIDVLDAWFLDRAFERILSSHFDGAVCLARFPENKMTIRRGLGCHPERLYSLSDPERMYEVLVDSGIRISLGQTFKHEFPFLKNKLREVRKAVRYSAALDCLKASIDERRTIPGDMFTVPKDANGEMKSLCRNLKYSGVEWFEENEPELFEKALENNLAKYDRLVADDCEGFILSVMGLIPLYSDDPIFAKYEPPLLPIIDGVNKYEPFSLSVDVVLEAMGIDDQYPYSLDVLVRADGSIHIDTTSSFLSSEYADSDFAYVAIEALKAGYAPADACDWEAGEEYISRLAAALRTGMPFDDLVAGEERERLSWVNLKYINGGA